MTIPLIDKLDINTINDTITRINSALQTQSQPAPPQTASSGGSLLIWDKIIDKSNLTAVTTNGEITLDGNAHGGYEFEFIIFNTSGSALVYRLYYNNDTTNTNYYAMRQYGGAVTGGDNANDAWIINPSHSSGEHTFGSGTINISPNGYIVALGDGSLSTNFIMNYAHRKTAAVANLTRIDIVSSIANGIGVDSRFRLWRRK